jgi:hypothetical protein
MTFNTTNSSTKHAKSLVHKLRADKVLPFTDVLSAKSIANKINNLNYRERIFSPDLTIYGFLSQAINADPSCQAAVSQIITHLISQGFDAPSANTSGDSQARSRLPQEILSDLAKEAAHELEKNIPNNWLWRNRNVKLVDGTTLSMPDTAADIREVKAISSRNGFRDKSRIIVTTILCNQTANAQGLGELYALRWFCELDFNALKTIMTMGVLRSKRPNMVYKEIWAYFLASNLVRKIMTQAAIIHNKIPRKMSFKLALQMICSFRQNGMLCDSNEYYLYLLKSIAYKDVNNRPGRSEPRRVKRRPKPCKLLQKNRKFYKQEALSLI